MKKLLLIVTTFVLTTSPLMADCCQKNGNCESKQERQEKRWAAEDAAAKRRLDKWEMRLNNMERAHALKERETDLISKGVISRPKTNNEQKGGFYFRDSYFSTLAEFKESNEFKQLRLEQLASEAKRLAQEEAKEQKIKEYYVQEYKRRVFANPIYVHNGRIYSENLEKLITLREPDEFEQIRLRRALVNNPDAFMKKFNVTFDEWVKFRGEIRDNDLGIKRPKKAKK